MSSTACLQVAFVFVCQRGRLEIESLLLAASLKKHLRGEFEMIAAIPSPTERFGKLQPATVRSLRTMGVRLAPLANAIIDERPSCNPSDLLTNKIFCLRVPTTADKLVFLDSDQLCRREFAPGEHLRLPLCARRADFVSSRDVGEAWERIFHAAGEKPPHLRLRVPPPPNVTGSVVYAPPSFNSSLIAIDTSLAAEFSQLWEECFRRIERAGVMGHARYYQEQASLAVAAHKSGIHYEMLDVNSINPYIAHYFRPERLQADPKLLELARSLARQQQGIDAVIRELPEWKWLNV